MYDNARVAELGQSSIFDLAALDRTADCKRCQTSEIRLWLIQSRAGYRRQIQIYEMDMSTWGVAKLLFLKFAAHLPSVLAVIEDEIVLSPG